jgi:hypothetical protein
MARGLSLSILYIPNSRDLWGLAPGLIFPYQLSGALKFIFLGERILQLRHILLLKSLIFAHPSYLRTTQKN